MPAKNSNKEYTENGIYHIYNRGVEKRPIFLDAQDYSVFLSYLKTCLLPKKEIELRIMLLNAEISCKEKDEVLKLLRLANFSKEIVLFAYCLMPNHFHLLLKQNSSLVINKFIKSLLTRYSMYFNKKYKRIGGLFQGVYKAVRVESDKQLLYLTSYIHRNPLPDEVIPNKKAFSIILSQPSSLPEYLGNRNTTWIHPEEILSYFSKANPNLSYKSFVEQTDDFSLIDSNLIDL